MGKYNKKKIELFMGIVIVFFIVSCNIIIKRKNEKTAVLTIIIKRDNTTEQRSFKVDDSGTSDLYFSEIIKDSVYQIQQSLLKKITYINVNGENSCKDSNLTIYYKTNKNDTIIFHAIYCLPIR